MKRIILPLFFCLLFPLAAHAADVKSIDMAGLTSILEQNRGKAVLVNFFATWCPPCRKEMPELVKLREAYPESEFLLVGLSVDEDASLVQPFIEKAGVNYPVFLAAQDITDTMGVTSVPHNAFYTPAGKMIISEPGMADVSVLKQVVNDLLGAE